VCLTFHGGREAAEFVLFFFSFSNMTIVIILCIGQFLVCFLYTKPRKFGAILVTILVLSK